MAAGEVVFDGATDTLTDDAARALYGIAADGAGPADDRTDDAKFPATGLGHAVA
jgi:hypothetical protein